MTRNLNGWQKLSVFLCTLSAVLFLSGCQKSDLENCVDAQMAALEDIHHLFSKEELEIKKKEWRANFYRLCSGH